MRVALRRSRRVSVTEAIVASMRAHLPSVSVMNIGRLRSSMAIDSLPAFKAPSPSVCAAVRARERERVSFRSNRAGSADAARVRLQDGAFGAGRRKTGIEAARRAQGSAACDECAKEARRLLEGSAKAAHRGLGRIGT